MSGVAIEAVISDVLGRTGAAREPGGEAAVRALLVELTAGTAGGESGEQARAAERLGALSADCGEEAAALVRRVTRLGRALLLSSLAAGGVDAEGAERLRGLVDAAVAQAVGGRERAQIARRESWLAYLTHEMKNPLNTIMNALWLVREQRAAPTAERFLEMSERAVRRLEASLRDLRDLHKKEQSAPPVKNQQLLGGH